MRTIYTGVATATSGRSGRVTSEDGRLDVALSVPGEMGGSGGEGTNPEQLFAGGYAACFGSAISLVARKRGIPLGDFEVVAHVALGLDGEGNYGLKVELRAKFHGVEPGTAEELLREAHAICPYSRAIQGNVEVDLGLE